MPSFAPAGLEIDSLFVSVADLTVSIRRFLLSTDTRDRRLEFSSYGIESIITRTSASAVTVSGACTRQSTGTPGTKDFSAGSLVVTPVAPNFIFKVPFP
ncbi:hypothetical protein BMS3Abin05_00005 [bacterium BMS3Abin05]|nr:hypothetical protein BMS3Abin05_00005 [bacterium BMS3Abin05]